nr:tyrosine-type recombinase/integrase [uncultured Dysosmobacter sp.]
MKRKKHVLTAEHIYCYLNYLREQERAAATLQKYAHDLNALLGWLDGRALTKTVLIVWKEELTATHAPATVNSMIAAVNGFLAFMGWRELAVKPLKIQKAIFCDEHRELTRDEYTRLVRAAERKENERLALILQTLCATGIRVSELKFITVEAVRTGRAEVTNKGKRRAVFLPDKLRRLLRKYLQGQKKTAGAVFTTRTGKPLDRSNIWRDMKALCESAGVEPGKVFPHNLRHLFARTYYSLEKDLSRLADILGHSSVNTTRIYTVESGTVHQRQMERMGLIIT